MKVGYGVFLKTHILSLSQRDLDFSERVIPTIPIFTRILWTGREEAWQPPYSQRISQDCFGTEQTS